MTQASRAAVLGWLAWAAVGLPVLAAEKTNVESASGPATERRDPRPAPPGGIEEVVVSGRQLSSATDTVKERMEQPVATDLINAQQIARVGDTTVAAALRRIPGVTLIDDQFVYVRGLGERYSSTRLNQAEVPSPDLTRNVIPLDIFPAAIIDALAVQKAYSPNMPAAFGGGTIGIRTRGVPETPVASFEIGSGLNTQSSGDGVKYAGGDDDGWGHDDGTRDIPQELTSAIARYQGDLGIPAIFQALKRDGAFHTIDEAAAINRELATTLYRNVNLNESTLDPDLTGEIVLGNRWYLGEQLEVGALGVGSYDNEWRNRDRVNRSVSDPDLRFFETRRTVQNIRKTAIANFGARYADDHEITVSNIFLRNTEDDAALGTGYNNTFALADGRQLRNYRLRWEERDLDVFQVAGRHTLGDWTREFAERSGLGFLPLGALEGLSFRWYYSDSDAETDIPNEVAISAEDRVDPTTGVLLSTQLRSTASAADYRFTELTDDVESDGWSIMLPLRIGALDVEITGGHDYSRKGRQYLQRQFFVGSTSAPTNVLAGEPETVLTDDHILDPANGFGIATGGIGTESYLAGQTLDAAFGMIDAYWGDAWRVSGGVRWEQFQQTSVPINPLEFDPAIGQVPVPPHELESFVFQEDDWYPGIALTWIAEDFWAETFQLRFGFSETVARPDLREISQATYIDPLTEARVTGNPDLVTSSITSYDVRAEWFFETGDNFTMSFFWKDIADPIEKVQGAGSDDNVQLSFINADKAEVYGVEVEWLKDLAFFGRWLGNWTEGIFVAGNFTFSDSEIEIGDRATDLTHDTRPMTEHSDYVVNLQLGYDSPDNRHALTLVYNVFGERLFFAGRQGADDAYEQPFHSLDLVYTWYPVDRVSMKLKLQNLLDEELEIEQSHVAVIEQEVGMSGALEMKWEL
jgi:outer membrane receptor protein involved in Fe transport